ncbi:hypothetical protein AVEN_10460-1 [Araneus ventricosus]|uniref:Uncharacterized protein n=1 Tax=Araneus ventricosus TaxID=182803 RepID=A0A4Y2N3P6_ARAVE|nr:hypothetical protein AVEN_10460-1 [Araneus ventricosus]
MESSGLKFEPLPTVTKTQASEQQHYVWRRISLYVSFAFCPSLIACLATSPFRITATACWIFQAVNVLFLDATINCLDSDDKSVKKIFRMSSVIFSAVSEMIAPPWPPTLLSN